LRELLTQLANDRTHGEHRRAANGE
jgi:hypothetical protein